MAFKLQIDKFINKTKARADVTLRAVSLEALTRITTRTPVDTGRARGNWNVGRNAPKSGDRIDPSGAATIADGAAMIESAKSGDRVFITNNLPYIHKLENGSSLQAPNGMVRLTVLELKTMINAAVARARREKP